MKVIVIKDSDGHISVYEVTVSNLKKCLEAFVCIGQCEENATPILNSQDTTVGQLIDFIKEYCPTGRSGGNLCNIVTIEEEGRLYYPWD